MTPQGEPPAPDHPRRPARGWRLLGLVATLVACEGGSARVKPWRHAPDPLALAETAPRSPVLAHAGDDVAVRARRDHTLRIHVDGEPRGLNPLLAPSVWTRRIMMGTVFETLVRYAPPEGGAGAGPGRYLPGLARAWRLQLQNTELIVELDPTARWHDGKPVTSVDVQYSLDIARDPGRKLDHLRPGLTSIESVELITAKSLRIRLHQPDGWVLRALGEVPIVPRAIYDPDLAGGGRLIGSGPYRVESTADGIVHLSRVEDGREPRPAIPDLEFVIEPDAAAALMAAKRGEIDIVPALVPEHWPEQPSAPGLAAHFVGLELRPPRFRYLLFAATVAPTDDVLVRRGLALLIDRKRLAQEVGDGLTRPIAGPIWPGGPGDGPAPAAPELDPAAAGHRFDEAGWIDSDGDGIREKGGTKLSLEVLVVEHEGGKPHPEQARILDAFRRAGIGLDVRAGTEAVLRNRIRDGHFNLAFLEWSGAVDSDLSALVGTEGSQNFGKFSSRQVDRALAGLRQMWEPASRGPLMGELAAALAEDMPLSGIVAAAPQGLVHQRVAGVVPWDGWFDVTALSLRPDPTTP